MRSGQVERRDCKVSSGKVVLHVLSGVHCPGASDSKVLA